MKSACVALKYAPIAARLYPVDKLTYLRSSLGSDHLALDALSISGPDLGSSKSPGSYNNLNRDSNVPVSLVSSSKHDSEHILVHLIDTPGHVDFYGQVYCSAQLADGTIIAVDVSEGICAQTMAAFHLAWDLRLVPVLFLNKIDRLIVELHLSPMEIFNRLLQLLESVNATCSIFRHQTPSCPLDVEEGDPFYFEPRKGNVLFGSALDGWAFRLNLFANLFSKKIPTLPKRELNQKLWSASFFLSKRREILPVEKGETPLFVSLIMENICSVYKALLFDDGTEQIQKICQSFSLSFTPASVKDRKMLLRTIFTSWIPLAPCVFDAIADSIPSAHSRRVGIFGDHCEKGAGTTLAFLAKPIIYPELTEELLRSSICEWTRPTIQNGLENEHESSLTAHSSCPLEKLVMMGRLYSGALSTASIGDIYFSSSNAIGFDGTKFDRHTFKLEKGRFRLYQLMGSKLIEVDCVPEGNIFGISGVLSATKGIFVKSGTLTSLPVDEKIPIHSYSCPSKMPLYHNDASNSLHGTPDDHQTSSAMMGVPLISVSVEPTTSLRDLTQLQFALLLLYQTDPSINVSFTDMGELILKTCGMLHLEQSLKELKSLVSFPISVSDPIVPLGETIGDAQTTKQVHHMQENFSVLACLNPSFFRDFSDVSAKPDALIETTCGTYTQNRIFDPNSGAEPDRCKLVGCEMNDAICSCVPLKMEASIGDQFCTLTLNVTVVKNNTCTPTLTIDPSCATYEEIIKRAFSIAISNGPLCGERVYGVGFSILHLCLDGQHLSDFDKTLLFSPIRKMLHLAILLADPKLMQGYNEISILVPGSSHFDVHALLSPLRYLSSILGTMFHHILCFHILFPHIFAPFWC